MRSPFYHCHVTMVVVMENEQKSLKTQLGLIYQPTVKIYCRKRRRGWSTRNILSSCWKFVNLLYSKWGIMQDSLSLRCLEREGTARQHSYVCILPLQHSDAINSRTLNRARKEKWNARKCGAQRGNMDTALRFRLICSHESCSMEH